jgi:hypothetical protein
VSGHERGEGTGVSLLAAMAAVFGARRRRKATGRALPGGSPRLRRAVRGLLRSPTPCAAGGPRGDRELIAL